jgi:hypothetical protein
MFCPPASSLVDPQLLRELGTVAPHLLDEALGVLVYEARTPVTCPQVSEERRVMESTGGGERVSFEESIRPLFRERDRGAMLGVAKFDLWEKDDVVEHSQAILERLENGSMPCDQAWPADRVALFREWVDSGMSE